MTGNPVFPNPVPTLAAVSTAVGNLATAETEALTRNRTAVALRDEKLAVVTVMLQELRGYVQSVADASPPTAASIIESAGMALRKRGVRPPRVFAVKPGPVSGSVNVVAARVGPRASYEWQYSPDGGKTWLAAPPTTKASTVITGLTPVTIVEFRYRAVTPSGVADWSQPLALNVS